MKDKKFLVLCILGGIWALLFFGMLDGFVEINPRITSLLAFLCLGWFAYWTISVIKGEKPSQNAKTEEKTEQSESE